MKKIIATVLAMVMALALCTTAFAATPDTYDGYIKGTNAGASVEPTTLTYFAAEDPTVNDDGEQTTTANIAYYTSTKTADLELVVVSTLAEADFVVYSDDGGKNVVMYLAAVEAHYDGTGTVFTNFGKKCGQVDYTTKAGKTYYTTNEEGNEAIYVTDEDGTVALMVGGKLVTVSATTVTTADAKKHVAVPTVKDGKVTGYTCSKCGVAAVEAANYASIPEDAEVIIDNWYFPVAGATTADTTATSPKTFDAGIAMYVGMALTSVAGSAVVIGKKKEF